MNVDLNVFAIATMDTKGAELQFLGQRLREAGVNVQLVDVSVGGVQHGSCDFTSQAVLDYVQSTIEDLRELDRGKAVQLMSLALKSFLRDQFDRGRVQGIIGLGGSGGTSMIAEALRTLPIGLPKIIVSTVASGNTTPYIGTSDIVLFPSIVDVAGLNIVSTKILSSAAFAISGMVKAPTFNVELRPAVGLTMFGVTTPCVNGLRDRLEHQGFDCLVFHATGTGGQAMEYLAANRMIGAILDMTTTEVADEIVGGVFRAGPDRFQVLSRRPIPCVMSVGAMDMVNFGPIDSVPQVFRNRLLHVHNANVTLMRTTADENVLCARWIAERIRKSLRPISVLLPEGGVSALDAPGKPFYDPGADEALFEELQRQLKDANNVTIRRLNHHINDREFIDAVLTEFSALVEC